MAFLGRFLAQKSRSHRVRSRPFTVAAAATALALALPLSLVPLPGAAAPISAAQAKEAPQAAPSQGEAVTTALKTKRPVTVTSMTGPQREVRALPDGRLEATMSARPVRTLRDGKWVPIDTKLRRRADGMLAPGATTVGLALSGGGAGPLVTMSRAGRAMSLTWPHGALPPPVVDGEAATYQNVLPDVDLVVRAKPSGFSHVLVVKTPAAARDPRLATVQMGLRADRMNAEAGKAGGLRMVDQAAGGTVFKAAEPMMWDSSGKGAGAGVRKTTRAERAHAAEAPADSVKRGRIRMSAGRGKLTLVPDAGLLTGADTTFPLYIDPDWQGPGESAAVMVSTKYTDSSWEDEGMGYCSDADPYMGGQCGGTITKRLFYKFVLPSAVMRTNVLWAEFKPYQTGAYNCTAAAAQVWKTKGVSGSTSWGTQAASGFWQRKLVEKSFNYGNEGVGCANNTVVLSSETLKTEVGNTANGSGTLWLGLKATNEGSTTGWKRFNNDAVLRVLYNLPPKTPTNVHLEGEGGTYPCGTNDVSSMPRLRVWPTMAAKIADPQGSDRVQAEFMIGWGDSNGAGFSWKIGAAPAPDSTPVYSGGGNSGQVFTKAMSALASSRGIPKNVPLAWTVRGHDFKDGLENDDWHNWLGAGYWADAPTNVGGLGHKCWFVYDDASPPPPIVTSAKYPANAIEHDGVGQPGDFTITAAPGSEPIVKFGYQFTPPGRPAEPIAWLTLGQTPGCTTTACTFTKTPDVRGDWKLNVHAVDRAGRSGTAPDYTFRVRRIASEEAHWKLDDPAGTVKLREEIAANNTFTAVNVKTGKCLNVEGGQSAPGTHIMQWDCDGVDWERWKLNEVDANTYTFVSKMSDKCLDIEGTPASTADGAHAIQSECAEVSSQRFQRVEQADGVFLLKPTHSNKCLTIDGESMDNRAHVLQQTCTGSQWEQWRLLSVNEASMVGTDYTLGTPARVGSSSLKLNADADPATTGYAETKLPLLDPTKNYAISAWAKLAAKGGVSTIASQDADVASSMYLQYSPIDDRWAFSGVLGDKTDAPGVRALSAQPPVVGQWTHLVGVYDASAKTIGLYVDGKLEQTTSYDGDQWAGVNRGAFAIGRAKYNGVKTDFFRGEIDDVRVFDRAVTAQDVAGWYRSTVQARWRLSAAPTNGVVPDDSGAGHDLTLYGGAEIKTDGETCNQLDGGCLVLHGANTSGVGEWARTALPVVRTDGSFSVAGWVDAVKPTVPMTVFSLAGNTQNAFTVRFNPKAAKNPNWDPDRDDPADEWVGRWEIEASVTDALGTTRVTAYQSQSCNICTDSGPDHLALVYDAETDTMTLYVNGNTSAESSKTGVIGFNAPGPVQIGRRFADGKTTDNDPSREYFAGLVRDVWLVKGALAPHEVLPLANLQQIDTPYGNPPLPQSYD